MLIYYYSPLGPNSLRLSGKKHIEIIYMYIIVHNSIYKSISILKLPITILKIPSGIVEAVGFDYSLEKDKAKSLVDKVTIL